MTEKTKLEHIRNNKDINIDYIKVYNQPLTKTSIKSLASLKYTQQFTLGEVIHGLATNIKELQGLLKQQEEKIDLLEQKVLQVEKVNLEIIKGKLAL